jgi:ech hydrogenase subunit E
MHSWRVREALLDIVEETTGGRVIFGSCKVGGVRRNIDNEKLKSITVELKKIEKMSHEITTVFEKDGSIKRRLAGKGVLSKTDAYTLGAVGPMLRASGVALDTRKLGYAAYHDLSFEPIIETAGDCLARCLVRVKEVYQSFDLIYQAIAKIPDSETEVKVIGNPPAGSESFMRLEQPRGEVVYYLKGSGTKFLQRFRVRTPTFANIAPLVVALKGCQLADVPNIVLTIDPCISCTER